MKKMYSFFGRKASLFLLSFGLLSAPAAIGQICGGIVENFNTVSNGTAGFTGDFSYDASGLRLIRNSVVATTVYSITTPTFLLSASATSIGYGFRLDGTEQVSRVEVNIVYVSTLTGQLSTVFLGQFVPNYGSGTTATICQAADLSTLPGFPVGGKYRFAITLNSSTGSGNAAQSIAFDDFRTNGTVTAPLPVTFIGFDARKTNAGAQLTWKVAGEENVNHYEVERSTDGRTYTSVVSLSVTKRDTYTYLDANTSSTVYYRIKNVDNDGKYKYSNIARISNGNSSIVINAFPQPVTSQLTIQHPVIKANALFTLTTADGRVINVTRPVAGSMQTFIDMSKLQKGLYVVRFNDGDGNTETLKVVRQ